ncbi:MAG: arginine repressor [Bacillota bacterium]|nr:MAG: arginine repressor [Bacillota bacterium]
MTKKERQRIVLELVGEEEIDTQEELTAKLNERGIEVTQATVSRDINELNLVKVAGKIKKFKYARVALQSEAISEKSVNHFKEIVESMTCANNLIVIKTISGNANAAASIVDKIHSPHVLGSVAGDDTLLIVAKSNRDAEIMLKRLKEMMG